MLNDETNFTVEIVSRNLAPQSKFVEFQDCQNFTFFEKKMQNQGTSDHMAPGGWTPGLPRGMLHERAALWPAWEAG